MLPTTSSNRCASANLEPEPNEAAHNERSEANRRETLASVVGDVGRNGRHLWEACAFVSMCSVKAEGDQPNKKAHRNPREDRQQKAQFGYEKVSGGDGPRSPAQRSRRLNKGNRAAKRVFGDDQACN